MVDGALPGRAGGLCRCKSGLGFLQVSMVDGALLDALEGVARHVRRSDKPFGGIQLVLSGAGPLCALALHLRRR